MHELSTRDANRSITWHATLGRYLVLMLAFNVTWEVLQLPLYTLWSTGGAGEIVFAVVHCTLGDLVIATVALVASLLILSDASWPGLRYWPVAILATLIGVIYTGYSEWVNVHVLKSWAYAPAMPVLPIAGVGLGPILQWTVLPPVAFALARRS